MRYWTHTTECRAVVVCAALVALTYADVVRGGEPAKVAPDTTVDAALRWLAEHQDADGSWNFDHRGGRCAGRCGDPGTISKASNAATAMAVLAMLRAGQTPKQGQHKDCVASGLKHLVGQVKKDGSLMDGGNMYSHGIATQALCEASRHADDDSIKKSAQSAVAFLVNAQDPAGGGWRYTPKMSGDTSVTGWQVAALVSAKDAGLNVPAATWVGAQQFLNSVQANDGATYGYTSPGAGGSTTAIGLLCRVRLGWDRENPAFKRGVDRLSMMGPSVGGAYFNYYSTQVLRHHAGEPWKKWQEALREPLVAAQSSDGHQAGSWHVQGSDHGAQVGGRLYCTAMNLLIISHLLER